jgi:hypothetical protein
MKRQEHPLQGGRNVRETLAYPLWALLALCMSTVVCDAQPVFNVNSTILSCDEYATSVLNNPWDMSDPADINHFTSHDVVDISNASFSSGLFNFTNTTAASGHFYLISPVVNGVQPVGGRWGQNFPIDTTQFKTLTIRMNLGVQDPAQFGVRVLWHRGKSGIVASERTITNLGTLPTTPGWRNYSIDLSTLTGFDGSSANPQSWTSAPVHGFGIYPLVSTGSGQIDYIRLENPASCGSTSVAYTSSSSGNNDLLSFYLDDDTDPFNGHIKKIATSTTAASNGSLSISSLGMMPGSYRLIARFDSDYAALEADNPWDMSDGSDISSTGEISNISFAGGALQGTTSGASPNIFFSIPSNAPIDASKYKRLSLKISTSTNTNSNPMLLYWTRADSSAGFKYLTQSVHDVNNDGIYHLDLSSEASWAGLITSLRLQVATTGTIGDTFALDFLHIRKTGLITTQNVGSTIASANTLTISDPPRVQVLQPDIKGGELFKTWDLRSGDVGLSYNVDSNSDPSTPAEPLTAYLPDVRSIGGTRGNIYKSTNIAGNGDPNEYMNFPSVAQNNYLINADEYSNLCVRMALNRDYDITLGSVTKYFYKQKDRDFESASAWATIYDRWSDNRWYEYCVDARTHPTESGTQSWVGMLEAFRVDPHEFSFDNCCDANNLPIGNPIQVTTYYDYIRLAKRDRSYGKFALAWQSQDSDTPTPSVSWEYASSFDFNAPIEIPSGNLSCEGRVCIWDTTSVPNGEYFLRATISDGSSSNAVKATGSLVISNGSAPTETPPVLYVEAPTASSTVCDNMQIKGFSLNTSIIEPVVGVQVFIDGVFQELIVPNEYHHLANINYPDYINDSGFNFSVSVSGLSLGTHTVTLKAYSSNGGVASQSISVQKQAGCTDLVVTDPTPGGSPLRGAGPVPPTATPSVLPSPTIVKAAHSRTGAFTMTFRNLPKEDQRCSVKILVGPTSARLSSIKSFTLTAKERTMDKMSVVAPKVKVNSKRLKRVLLGAQSTCGGRSSSPSTASVRLRGTGSITKTAQLHKQLRSRLKKSPP